MAKEIYIVIEGGLVRSVWADDKVDVYVIDWDDAVCNADAEEECIKMTEEINKKKLVDWY